MEARNRMVMLPMRVNIGADDRSTEPDVVLLVRISILAG
jgi:hypothetical protein